jgi:DNA-directed RNA polymerase specialized sigma24 family protein
MEPLDATTADRVLIREYLYGNVEAFRLLSARHQPSLLHYARGFVPSEEAAQAVVRRALRRGFGQLPRLRPNSLLSSFLIGILRDELKRQGTPSAPPDVDPLWAGLAGLPRVQREVVFLFFGGFDLRDVARIRHEAPSHTRARFANALSHVAKKAGVYAPAAELPPGCLPVEEIHLLEAGALPPERAAAIASHTARCERCAERHQAGAAFIARLRETISPLNRVSPILPQIPGPSLWSTAIGSGIVLALAVICFLLARLALEDRAKPVRELPSGEVRVLEEPAK